MNIKKLLIASVVGFVFVFIFEMLWHGFLMKGMYEATSSVWRPEEEHNFPIMMASQFLFALAMAFGWAKIGQHGTCKKGIGFGVCVGLIMAAPDLGAHCYLPIPITISLMWMGASMIKALGTGVVVAKLYKD